jgi:hypothetical protein
MSRFILIVIYATLLGTVVTEKRGQFQLHLYQIRRADVSEMAVE